MANEETKKAESTEAPQTATAGTDAPQQDPTALSIGDLRNLSTILDVASTRGAFKAAELAGVGTLFNKLNTFLVNVEKQPGAQPTAEAPKEK